MSFYRERVYPHLVRLLGNPKPIADIRKRILPAAKGDVLEIGVGPGVNFPHYDPAKMSLGAKSGDDGSRRRAAPSNSP